MFTRACCSGKSGTSAHLTDFVEAELFWLALSALSDSASEGALLEGKVIELGVMGMSEPSGMVGIVKFSLSSARSRKLIISIGGGRFGLDGVRTVREPRMLWLERARRERVDDGDEGIGGRGPLGGGGLTFCMMALPSERARL